MLSSGLSLRNASQAQRILLTLPDAQLQRVVGNSTDIVHTGKLELVETTGPGADEDRIRLQTSDGLTFLSLGVDTPALKTAENTYTFSSSKPPSSSYHTSTSTSTSTSTVSSIMVLSLATDMAPTHGRRLEYILVQICDLSTLEGVPLHLSDAEVAIILQANDESEAGTIHLPGKDRTVEVIGHLSQRLVEGIVYAGGVAGDALRALGNRVKEHMGTREGPPVTVNPRLKAAAGAAKRGAAVGVVYTAAAGTVVAGAARELGSAVARKVKERTTKADGTSALDGEVFLTAAEVGGAVLSGLTDVYFAMAEATRLVLAGAADAVAAGVEHRYGPDAGAVAGDAGEALQAGLSMRRNLRVVAVRGVAKHAAQGVAREIKERDDVDLEEVEGGKEEERVGKEDETHRGGGPASPSRVVEGQVEQRVEGEWEREAAFTL